MRSNKRTTKRAPQAAARKAAKRPLRRAAAPASRAKEIELALAAFAHEVRTPLTGILAIADLLDAAGLEERPHRWAKSLKASAEHLSALTTLIVDSARLSHAGSKKGAAILRHEDFDLGVVAQQAADSLRARAEAKGLAVKTSIGRSVSGIVSGDAVRLRAALENLIDNAVKFTERGFVALKVTAKPAGQGTIEVAFEIRDSGIGLSPADIRALFQPFARAGEDVRRRYAGAGLGLYAVRAIARAMGGDVKAASMPGRGATFTMTMRVARVRRRRDADADVTAASAPALSLLCVEDNPYGRVVMKTILTELGHRVRFAGDGDAALAALREQKFDAVLMDLVLPGESGIAVARRIRSLPKPLRTIPIIGLSGADAQQDNALAAGMNAFLVKPVAARALADALAATASRATRNATRSTVR